MASLDVNRLMDSLRIRLPGAIDDTIRLELFAALNEFFQGSNIWREDIDIAVSAGVDRYDLFPTDRAKVVRLMGIVDDNELPTQAVFDLITTELVLAQKPSKAGTYTAQVSLTVDDPVNSEGYPAFPAWVLALYQNEIIDGVLARMMSQPAKPYSNLQLASFHNKKFTGAIADARIEAQRRYVFGAQSWRFPQTFNRYKARR